MGQDPLEIQHSPKGALFNLHVLFISDLIIKMTIHHSYNLHYKQLPIPVTIN